jgi:hypothetical protein
VTTATITRPGIMATAGRARFALCLADVSGDRPAPLMRPQVEDMQRGECAHVSGMTFVEVLAALYGFGPVDDPKALWAMSLAHLRAEVARVVEAHGMAAIRETARWIWVHGEGVEIDGPHGGRVEYGVHSLVLRMSAARPHAARLLSAHGDEFWQGAE